MWPWEHLAVGYLAYSLLGRALGTGRPTTGEAVVLAFATQFPDLVDKPLGWGTTLLPSGVSLGHSLLFALPVVLVVQVVAAGAGRRRLGAAFAVGYLSHLPADVLYPVLIGGSPSLSFLLWPLVPATPAGSVSILSQVGKYLGIFLEVLQTPRGRTYIMMEALLLAAAAMAWVFDGHPGTELFRRRSTEL